MNIIPHNKPYLGQREEKAVNRVLRSSWLIEGKEVGKLQKYFGNFLKVNYTVCLNSGLSALHVGLIALGITKDDEVILPTYTCVALLHAVDYVGAKPIIIDIEKNGFNINPQLVLNNINKRTKAIILPHTFGFPAAIDELRKLNIPIIEDCAQALGSTHQGKPLGCFGDISIFSFYASKMIAAGQGGLLATNNKDYYEKVIDLIHPDKRQNYITRFNYQLTDIAAALANVQFKKLPIYLKKRRSIASRYRKILNNYPEIEYWPNDDDAEANHFRFILRFKDQQTRDKVKHMFLGKGVSTIVPIDNYQLLHNYLGLSKKDFPNAESLAQSTLSLPIYPCLSRREISIITSALKSIIENL